ncbi:DNA methyltransferase [Geothrix sp.]|uniref:DNA methyltransferase n=1 Tax=Geothrix sp. TaxID=1962974 RepID=UPI0025C6975B|nr:DNA methyltransferase [Geothrix sp.]WIL20022.1 MAG: site-specific DNA-methyltransferase [Geothrix sp.]
MVKVRQECPSTEALLKRFPPRGAFEIDELETKSGPLPRIIGEFWAPGQRNGHSLHEISYRACYKPELPALFIEALTQPGDAVYDPFGGRGTTALEAALRGRRPISNDVNPLSEMLLRPRLTPPAFDEIAHRLTKIPRHSRKIVDLDLSMFFHIQTESEIRALRVWFKSRRDSGAFDAVDAWIRMVALNRLTGHSAGFFSIYSLPPNQAMPAKKQLAINQLRDQVPPYRDTHALIRKKTKALLRDFTSPEAVSALHVAGKLASLHCGSAEHTPDIPSESVDLVVTSPPFLDVVQYHTDNWMRNWFAAIDESSVEATFIYERTVEGWCRRIEETFKEIHRVMKPGAWFVMEVGEIKKATLNMEDLLLPIGEAHGFHLQGALIHTQAFTKTAHIWGVGNNEKGTNSQRMVLFQKR